MPNKTLLLFCFSILGLSLSAQTKTTLNNKIDERFYNDMSNLMYHKSYYYRWGCVVMNWGMSDKLLGIVPEYQWGNKAVSLGLFQLKEKDNRILGHYHMGILLNTGFLTESNTYTSSVNVWLDKYFVGVFGGVVRARASAYWAENKATTYAIRPEAGISIYNFHILYGYDFFSSTNENQSFLKNNNITVSCLLPLRIW